MLDVDDLLATSAFLAMLPGVKPRVAKAEIRNLFDDAVIEYKDEFRVGEEAVTVDEANELFISTLGVADRVSPKGARLLIRLYRAGALPMKWAKPRDVPENAQAYADSQADLEERARVRQEKRRAEEQAYQAKLERPEDIAESKFTYRLLDDLFWYHLGKGEGTLTVGGLEVHKSLVAYKSNSGKSRDFTVTFSWTSPKHGTRVLEEQSEFAQNRRNDADRN